MLLLCERGLLRRRQNKRSSAYFEASEAIDGFRGVPRATRMRFNIPLRVRHSRQVIVPTCGATKEWTGLELMDQSWVGPTPCFNE